MSSLTSTHPRLASSPLLHRGICALARVREIFAEQLNRHRSTSADLARRNFIRKIVPGVVAVRFLAAGCNYGRTADCHSFPVGATPVTIDCICARSTNKSKRCGASQSDQKEQSVAHSSAPLCSYHLHGFIHADPHYGTKPMVGAPGCLLGQRCPLCANSGHRATIRSPRRRAAGGALAHRGQAPGRL